MAFLLDILEAYRLGACDAEDERIWLPDEEKGFSVISIRDARSQPPHLFP